MIHPTSVKIDDRTAAIEVAKSKPAPAPSSSPAVPGESLSTGQTEALRQALINSPEIRPDVVARGLQLAADPDYPSADIINRVSALIVNSEDPSEQGS